MVKTLYRSEHLAVQLYQAFTKAAALPEEETKTMHQNSEYYKT